MTSSTEQRTLAGFGSCTTARLRLEPLTEADAPALSAISDDPAIINRITFLRSPFTPEDARLLIRGDGRLRDRFLGLWRKEDGRLIGVIGVHLRGDDEVEVGYWLATAMQRQGYASEALSAVIELLARDFADRRILARLFPDNPASLNLLRRHGFEIDNERSAGLPYFILRRPAHDRSSAGPGSVNEPTAPSA